MFVCETTGSHKLNYLFHMYTFIKLGLQFVESLKWKLACRNQHLVQESLDIIHENSEQDSKIIGHKYRWEKKYFFKRQQIQNYFEWYIQICA